MSRYQGVAVLATLLLGLQVQAQYDAVSRRDDKAYKTLGDIVDKGADMYNRGDREGCHRFFQGTLMVLKDRYADDAELSKIIAKALADDEKQASVGHRAFGLRSAILQVRDLLGPNPGARSVAEDTPAATPATESDASEASTSKEPRRRHGSAGTAGFPPQQVLASLDDEGNVVLKYRAHKPVWYEETREVNGQQETFKKVKWVAEEHMRKVNLKDVQVYTLGGRRVDSARLPQLLAKGRVVLTANGDLPDPSYLQFYKEGTLILVTPMPAPPTIPAPAAPQVG